MLNWRLWTVTRGKTKLVLDMSELTKYPLQVKFMGVSKPTLLTLKLHLPFLVNMIYGSHCHLKA